MLHCVVEEADTVAKKQAAKSKPRETVPQAGAAGDMAQAIGESLADLMNRKDALVRQLADVNQRIASASQAGRRLLAAAPQLHDSRAVQGRRAEEDADRRSEDWQWQAEAAGPAGSAVGCANRAHPGGRGQGPHR